MPSLVCHLPWDMIPFLPWSHVLSPVKNKSILCSFPDVWSTVKSISEIAIDLGLVSAKPLL